MPGENDAHRLPLEKKLKGIDRRRRSYGAKEKPTKQQKSQKFKEIRTSGKIGQNRITQLYSIHIKKATPVQIQKIQFCLTLSSKKERKKKNGDCLSLPFGLNRDQ